MQLEPLAYLNGQYVGQSGLTLKFYDVGFVYGATVTDFCRTYRQKLFRWPDHLARLRRDCEELGIPLNISASEITSVAERLVKQNSELYGPKEELSLITFATPGPMGILIGKQLDLEPTLGMHTAPLPMNRYRRMFTDGITLSVAGLHPSDSLVPCHVKHRSRMHWWVAQRAVTDPLALPVLLDQNGTPDTPIGAVLVVRGDQVFRPLRGSVLESVSLGVVRDLCHELGLKFTEERVELHAIMSDPKITEVLLAGSGFGLAGVRRIHTTHAEHAVPWPGPILQRLQHAWSELVGLDIVKQFTE